MPKRAKVLHTMPQMALDQEPVADTEMNAIVLDTEVSNTVPEAALVHDVDTDRNGIVSSSDKNAIVSESSAE